MEKAISGICQYLIVWKILSKFNPGNFFPSRFVSGSNHLRSSQNIVLQILLYIYIRFHGEGNQWYLSIFDLYEKSSPNLILEIFFPPDLFLGRTICGRPKTSYYKSSYLPKTIIWALSTVSSPAISDDLSTLFPVVRIITVVIRCVRIALC
jgi:hypothetical protein